MDVRWIDLPWLTEPPPDFRQQVRTLATCGAQARPTAQRLASCRLQGNRLYGLGDAVALHDGEDSLLHGREPLATFRARPTATDQLTVVGLTRVDHARIRVSAVRAPHRCPPVVRNPVIRALTTTSPGTQNDTASGGVVVDNVWRTWGTKPQPVDDLHPCNY